MMEVVHYMSRASFQTFPITLSAFPNVNFQRNTAVSLLYRLILAYFLSFLANFRPFLVNLSHFSRIWILLSCHLWSIWAVFCSFGPNGRKRAKIYSQSKWSYTSQIRPSIVMNKPKGPQISQTLIQSGSKGIRIYKLALNRHEISSKWLKWAKLDPEMLK